MYHVCSNYEHQLLSRQTIQVNQLAHKATPQLLYTSSSHLLIVLRPHWKWMKLY